MIMVEMNDNEILQLGKDTIKTEAQGILALVDQLDESFIQAVKLLLNCQGHVLVSGSGTSSAVARRMAHLMTVCGTPALLLDAGDGPHGGAAAVTEKDMLIALSKGGTTKELVFLASVAKDRRAYIIAITENPESELGRLSDVVLKVNAPVEGDPFGMIATGSSLINCALGDALCVTLLKLRGYTIEQFGATHPGGAVGDKLKKLRIISS
jgi:arabinose-5-phosphate isomerase